MDTRIPGEMSGKHLFGDMGGTYIDGFEKLSLLDENKDGKISGSELEGLMIWIDENSDAEAQPGELHTLESKGIVEIATTHSKMVSTAKLGNGEIIETEDLWFLEPDQRRRRL